MKTRVIVSLLLIVCLNLNAAERQLWPDGTEIADWFSDTARVEMSGMGRRYVVTDYGVVSDTVRVQTRQLQAVIDR